MNYINKQRAKEILKEYEQRKDLFNWCEEYKNFVSSCVGFCVSHEWEYIIKKSFEDREAPFSYDDIDLLDYDAMREDFLRQYNEADAEDKKGIIEDLNLNLPFCIFDFDEEKESIEEFLNNLDDEDILKTFENLNYISIDTDVYKEVYEWWLVSDPLAYRLEKQGEVFLNGAWGRCTTGQSVSLDYCVIRAFISWLEDMHDLKSEGVQE